MRSFAVTVLLLIGTAAQDWGVIEPWPNVTITKPVGLFHDGTSDLIYVIAQAGVIYVIDTRAAEPNATVFMDIRDRVRSGGERGLLGLAFHPNYQQNGHFFVNYIDRNGDPGNTVISRFTRNGDENTGNPELNILGYDQPYQNHNGGCVWFGSDGYLYISSGDGGRGGGPGQDLETALGNILRIDVNNQQGGLNYAIPPTNPFVGQSGVEEAIWAYGFRNPWRCSLDKPTNRVWCGDVGEGAWEEIDIVESGKNYGWNVWEGKHCFNSAICSGVGMVLPVHEYGRGDGKSITGGYVYRGNKATHLIGKYIFADYISGNVWALTYDESNPTINSVERLFRASFKISSFGVDREDNLYFMDHSSGRIYAFNEDGEQPTFEEDPTSEEISSAPALYGLGYLTLFAIATSLGTRID